MPDIKTALETAMKQNAKQGQERPATSKPLTDIELLKQYLQVIKRWYKANNRDCSYGKVGLGIAGFAKIKAIMHDDYDASGKDVYITRMLYRAKSKLEHLKSGEKPDEFRLKSRPDPNRIKDLTLPADVVNVREAAIPMPNGTLPIIQPRMVQKTTGAEEAEMLWNALYDEVFREALLEDSLEPSAKQKLLKAILVVYPDVGKE